MNYKLYLILLLVFANTASKAQDKDSVTLRPKVLHAEPLYIDLIRDLGARKGEKEWNIGLGLTDNTNYDAYTALVEYEFAPIDRLGFEIELPFTFYYKNEKDTKGSVPGNTLNSLKLATQYSFFVSEKMQTSMAIGYIHEFELTEFKNYGKQGLLHGNVYNPFFVIAKKWGGNFHSMVYTGPYWVHHFNQRIKKSWQHNTSVHYMIPRSKNFIGIEFNKEFSATDFDMTIRPQFRLAVTDNLLMGIVTGIPVKRKSERFSSFLRLIYEPKHK